MNRKYFSRYELRTNDQLLISILAGLGRFERGVYISGVLLDALKMGVFDIGPSEIHAMVRGVPESGKVTGSRRYTFTVLNSVLYRAIKLYRLAYGTYGWTYLLRSVIRLAHSEEMCGVPVMMRDRCGGQGLSACKQGSPGKFQLKNVPDIIDLERDSNKGVGTNNDFRDVLGDFR
jgi:hypothetical protein